MPDAEHRQQKPATESSKDQQATENTDSHTSLSNIFSQLQHASRKAPTVTSVVALQRVVGNRQTQRILQRDKPEDSPLEHRDRILKKLIAGDYTHEGAFKTEEIVIEGKPYQVFESFVNADLQFLLSYYIRRWAPLVPNKASRGGDSAGKSVIDHPAWVTEFQQRLIGQRAATDSVKAPKNDDPYAEDPLLKWDDASEGAQRLVEAYLNAWVVQKQGTDKVEGQEEERAASNVEEFIHNIGVSQSNDQALLLGGKRGLYDWCANSSGRAVALGLMRRGLRFKSYNPPNTAPKNAPTGSHLQALLQELNIQASRFMEWGGELSKGTDKEKAAARKGAEDKGRVINGKAAWTAELKPGDFITIIFGGTVGPISGHVATVVKEDFTQDKETVANIGPQTNFSRVSIVSGNAAGVTQGETAIRIESFNRQRPPDGYPDLFRAMVADANVYQYQVKKSYDAAKRVPADKRSDAEKALVKRGDELLAKDHPVHRVDGNKFKPGVHAPVESDSGWVLSITRSSMLDANSMVDEEGKADQATLEKQGLVVFDEASLKNPNAGLERLYPGVLDMYE